MENRERDRVSERTSPTDAGEVNRRTEEERSRRSGTGAEFGQEIGRAENLREGGVMRNRNEEQELNSSDMSSDKKNINNSNLDSESSRRSGSGSFGSSSGRRGGMEDRSEVSREEKSPGRGNTGNIDSSEGRH